MSEKNKTENQTLQKIDGTLIPMAEMTEMK